MLKKKGFTLSEVMLTLGVIGTLAAILIPVVFSNMPSTSKIMFRKAHFALEKALGALLQENTAYPTDEMGTASDTGDRTPRGFNFTTATENGTTNKFCFYFVQQLSTNGTMTCPSVTAGAGVTKFASTLDDVVWYIYLPASDASPNTQFPLSASSYPTKIIIDANGAKAPNCFTDTGFATYVPNASYKACTNNNPDTFVIGIRYDGKIQVGSGVDAGGKSLDAKAKEILLAPRDNVK